MKPAMTRLFTRLLISLPLMTLGCPALSLAADTSPTPVESAKADDFAIGKKALAAKNWSLAAESFKKVVADNPKNADG
jgi:hypothetical protein